MVAAVQPAAGPVVFAAPIERALSMLSANVGTVYAKAEPTLRVRLGFYFGRQGMTPGDLRDVCREMARPDVQAEFTYGGDIPFLAAFAAAVVRVMETRRRAERLAAERKQADADRARAVADRPAASEVLRRFRERRGAGLSSPFEDFDYGQGESEARRQAGEG